MQRQNLGFAGYLPVTTSALCYQAYGDESRLAWAALPLRRPGRGEVVIGVAAVSVNPVDWKILAGEQRLITGHRLSKPRCFGGDFAGTVLALGPGVRYLSVGDRVCGLLNPLGSGSFRHHLVLPAAACARIPDSVGFREAAALPAAGIAAIRAFRHCPAAWWAGKAVYLNGAPGGVGHLLLQLLARQGAEVWASGSPERHPGLMGMGAARTVDYRLAVAPADLSRFDAVVDCHGSLALARPRQLFGNGRGLFIPLSIANPQIPAVLARATWRRLSGGTDTRIVLAAPSRVLLEDLLDRCAAGSLRPCLDAAYPMERAREAVARSRTGHAFGKIIVDIGP
jgi:NADPH:quinone reductase-like Zn-dependent oxidoreductase